MILHLPKADPEKELRNGRGSGDRKLRELGSRTVPFVTLKVTRDKLLSLS